MWRVDNNPFVRPTNLPRLAVANRSSGLAVPPLEPRDQPRSLPNLAVTVAEPVSRRLDRLLVVVGVDPFAGRNPAHAIEAVKPV